MKKMILTGLLAAVASLGAMAQGNDTIKVAAETEDLSTKLIPISREQAATLVTRVVTDMFQERVKAARTDSILLAMKVETLKRKMLDDALRSYYVKEAKSENDRLDRLERLVYLSLLQSGKITPEMLQTIIPLGSGTTTSLLSSSPYGLPYGYENPQTRAGLAAAEGSADRAAAGAKVVESASLAGGHSDAAPAIAALGGAAAGLVAGSAVNHNGKIELTRDTVFVEKEIPKTADPFTIRLYFNFDSSNINDVDSRKLDRIVEMMKAYPNLNIQLKGYSSPRGNLQYNNKLSLRRVKACAEALVQKGVPAERMTVVKGGIDSVTATSAEARRVDITPYYGN